MKQYTRLEDVIITGLKTHHKSYARTTHTAANTDDQFAPSEELDSLEKQVMTFLSERTGVDLGPNDVSACHTMRGKEDIPNIVLRLTNRKTKTKLLRETRKLKGTSIYLNEH